jgi:methylated-DNA-[protein]-cysteine S-methyltransferase
VSALNVVDESELRRAVEAGTRVAVDHAALTARLAARAEAEGLLEVAYCSIDSPVGPLLASATPRGLVALGLPNFSPDEQLALLAAEVSPRLLEAPARLDPVRRELEEYFAGERRHFDLALDWRLTGGFTRKVLRATARIPFGETRSYGQMAISAGSPRAFRAAGSALGSNPIPIVVPCHRVLRTGGALGGYAGGLDIKRRLLELEGALT